MVRFMDSQHEQMLATLEAPDPPAIILELGLNLNVADSCDFA